MLNYNELKYIATKVAADPTASPSVLAAMGAPKDVIRSAQEFADGYRNAILTPAVDAHEKALINAILAGGLGGGVVGGVAGGLGEHLFSKEKEKNYLKSILLGAGAGAGLGAVGGGAMKIGPYLGARKSRDAQLGMIKAIVGEKTSAVKQAIGELTATNMALQATQDIKDKYPEPMGYGGAMGIGAAGGAIAGIPVALLAHALMADKKNKGLRNYLKSSLLGALIGGGLGAAGGAGYKALGFAEPEMTEGRVARNIQKRLYDYDTGKQPAVSKEEDEKNKDAPEKFQKSLDATKARATETQAKIKEIEAMRNEAQRILDAHKKNNDPNVHARSQRQKQINEG